MTARRAGRAALDEQAGAEVVGAILTFGIFVTAVAVLNVTAVPQAGLDAEEEHVATLLDRLNGLQSSAEGAALAGSSGATASAAVPLSPARNVGQDFFSFFLATPARAAGELRFVADYGNVTLLHYRAGESAPVADVGSASARLPLGRLTLDPHPLFRAPGVIDLENGALVTREGESSHVRFEPPVSVSVSGSTTRVTVKVRVLNGTDATLGGTADVRVALETEASTLSAPVANHAERVVLRLETAHGSAWGAFLNESSERGGLTTPLGYQTTVSRGTGEHGLDAVTWDVRGVGSGNDVRLTSGITVFTLRLS